MFYVRVFVQKLNFLAHFEKHFTSYFILCDFIQCYISLTDFVFLFLLLLILLHSISVCLVLSPFHFCNFDCYYVSYTVSISHFLSFAHSILFSLSHIFCFAIVLIFAWLCISRVSTLNHHKIKTMNVVGISSC